MKNYKIRQENIDFCNEEENHPCCQAMYKQYPILLATSCFKYTRPGGLKSNITTDTVKHAFIDGNNNLTLVSTSKEA